LTTETKLQARAWAAATPVVQEAAARASQGLELADHSEDVNLTIADAITLLRLSMNDLESIAARLDPAERSAKPRSTLLRMQHVAKATRAAVSRGFEVLDSDSLLAFFRSPMRANIPRILQTTKKTAIKASFTGKECAQTKDYPRSMSIDFRKLDNTALQKYVDHYQLAVRASLSKDELAVAVRDIPYLFS